MADREPCAPQDAPGTLLALLDWYRAMGVETATGEESIDWLSRPGNPPGAGHPLARIPATGLGNAPTRPSPPPAPVATRAAPSRDDPSRHRPAIQASPPANDGRAVAFAPAVADSAARGLARASNSLGDLTAALQRFEGCGLKSTAKNLCVYRGAERARLMLIGEAPGRDEDLAGKPFVGPAGQLLDRMLKAIELAAGDVHITNIVYWRPPGNRTPTPQEAEACRPFLERQVELVGPDFVLLLGGVAAQQVLNVQDGISRLRGSWRDVTFGSRRVRAIATFHPAFLLRSPAHKRHAWRDLLAVQAALGEPAWFDAKSDQI